NDAAMFKNDAAIKKTEASNQWNYYQSKSAKQNLAELAMALPGVNVAKYEDEVKRYKKEKEDIKKEAEKLEKASKDFDDKSAASIHTHLQWAQATTAVQVSISLAAITLLTRRKWMQNLAYAVAAVGLVMGSFAWFHLDPFAKLLGAH
ncbi:MAG: DUF4337 family protein, partial [Burkholderiales bacterium]|nr:DUF4337 family protein [Burkholderiales bacterium]